MSGLVHLGLMSFRTGRRAKRGGAGRISQEKELLERHNGQLQSARQSYPLLRSYSRKVHTFLGG